MISLVRPLEEIHDVGELRERARVAEASNAVLSEQVDRLLYAIAKEEAQKQRLWAEIQAAAQMAARHAHGVGVPGFTSEKRPKPDEAMAEQEPQRGHGPTPQPLLPLIEEPVQKLDEADCICPSCGGQLLEWKDHFEESEEIDVVVRQHVRKQRRRQKYRCKCGHIDSPLALPRVVPGGRYSNEFALQTVADKHLDHLPLERQVRRAEREGLIVTSQTLWDQEWALYQLLLPAKERLKRYLLSQRVLGGDETRWPVFGKETKNWTMWCVSAPFAVMYEILDGRGGKQAELILREFKGILVVDGYGVYEWLHKEYREIELAFCWSHVRRHFLDIESGFPTEVKRLLDVIGKLFAVEKKATSKEQLALLRQTESKPIVEEIYTLLTTTPGTPGSGLRKAMEYAAGRWTGLSRFLTDPDIPLSNNATERAQRGPVVGRKNFYGSHSRAGTQVAAFFYSLFESAKLCGLNPVAYVRLAMNLALAKEQIPLPHEVMDRAELRLPDSS
jgi:transposase